MEGPVVPGDHMGLIEIFGAWVSISAAMIGYLYRQLWNMRDEMQDIASEHVKDIWTAVNGIRTDIDADRRAAADARIAIAANMVTRDELDRQINRLIREFDRKLTPASRRHIPSDD